MRKTAIKKDKRTRLQKNFQQTVLKLYRKKTLDEITINEVCDKVGVPRSSFYYHYNTIRDVLEEIEKDFIKELSEALKKLSGERLKGKELFVRAFEEFIPVIKANEQFIKAIMVERLDFSFMAKCSKLVKEIGAADIADPLKNKILAYATIFSVGDMLATGVAITKEKGELIYDNYEKLYIYKKELLEL